MSADPTALAPVAAAPLPQDIEQVLLGGNLASLTPDQRIAYYKHTCDSLGLNPLTKPFEYITLNGRLVLYVLRAGTDQLRKLHRVSLHIAAREVVDGVYLVTAQATDASGRTDESIGAVPIANLRGEALANACMKAETKAKRRVTLSICGLGWLDETELETIPGTPQHAAQKAPRAPVASALPAPPPESTPAPVDAPAPASEPQWLLVLGIQEHMSLRSNALWWELTLSDGTHAATNDLAVSQLAVRCVDDQRPVHVTLDKQPRKMPVIVELIRQPDPADTPPEVI